jgi:hypothetical protein
MSSRFRKQDSGTCPQPDRRDYKEKALCLRAKQTVWASGLVALLKAIKKLPMGLPPRRACHQAQNPRDSPSSTNLPCSSAMADARTQRPNTTSDSRRAMAVKALLSRQAVSHYSTANLGPLLSDCSMPAKC